MNINELKSVLSYNPETGEFMRLQDTGTRWKKGQVCGSVDNSGLSTAGYAHVYYLGKSYKAHRLAWFYMTGRWPKAIDHINHDRADNRWDNLREVPHSENTKNRSKNSNNTSGFRGVSWYPYKGKPKWLATIGRGTKNAHIGYFPCFLDAVAARIRAEKELGYHENHGV